MAKALCVFGVLGILTSTVYLAMVGIAVFRFHRRRKLPAAFAPAVSVLKPLHGAEPGLRECLESFFLQHYPQYELLFCARYEWDAGLRIARELSEKYPEVPVKILTCGEPRWPNAKCYSLNEMVGAAEHEILVIADSDVRVSPQYLSEIVAPLQEEGVGLVTSPYRGVAAQGGFWARLEALGMSVEMTSGVLVAEMLEGMHFALGPSMAVRSRCIAQIGGFGALGKYHAEDFMLGKLVAEKGNIVVLAKQAVEHCIVNTKFTKSLKHQLNWMRSTRFSRPKGHLGTALTFGVPYGILTFAAASLLGKPWLGLAALLWTVLLRVMQSALIGGAIVQDRAAVRDAWLYPLRDLLGSLLWVASYTGRKVGWRGDAFEISHNGLTRLVAAEAKRARAHEKVI
jgi:ceramide glucosyltransferase